MNSVRHPIGIIKVRPDGSIVSFEGDIGDAPVVSNSRMLGDIPLFAGAADELIRFGLEVIGTGHPAVFSADLGWSVTISPADGGDLWYILSHPDSCPERRSIEVVNHHLRILNAVVEAASSQLACHDILHACLWETIRLIDVDCGAIYIRSNGSERAEQKAIAGYVTYYFPDLLELNLASPTFSNAFSTRKPVFLEQYCDLEHTTGELGVFSLAVIPILSREEVLGVICCAHSKPRTYSALEESVLTSIGRSVGGAVRRGVLQQKYECLMEENTLLLDIMEHDIRNANMIAEGYLEMLSESPSQEYARKAQAGLEQSDEIIRNVRTIRLLGASDVRLSRVRIDEVIRKEIEYISGAEITCCMTTATVIADNLLSQIFSNLIGNSLKFGGEGTKITITLDEEGEWVKATVADNGPGIPAELKPILFSRHGHGGNAKSGSGLGLYIVRELVHRYGGKIEVLDLPVGTGIRFWLKKG
ncbi:GAF domain-containing sensor histidine kinase [Methanocalculus sp.]|uniref:GAF domain-containing sensor histidine kinase n=1 Tax=Methanocalculus sp. TaxID=2004547 RepID=UPI00271E7FC3|nr:GAF domain-containing sensor histidine kinase [Methanocalculus sp.]MDO8842268.1 GAF domain-containing sensor histidine kinase [Methanocalculus sp.]